jgi:polyisoprenoid-binding protein YceI
MSRYLRRLAAPALIAAGALAPDLVAAETWQIDNNHSSAQFSVTHLMISTVRGEFSKMSGTIDYDGKSVESIKADVTIDAASITTHADPRDADLKSPHFFDVAKFPTLTFKSKKAIPGAAGMFKLVGDLTLHGVTKEVTLDCTGPSKIVKSGRGESRVAASASVKINRQDYGMSWNATLDDGGAVVSDMVAITIEIEAKSQPPAPPVPPSGAAPTKP